MPAMIRLPRTSHVACTRSRLRCSAQPSASSMSWTSWRSSIVLPQPLAPRGSRCADGQAIVGGALRLVGAELGEQRRAALAPAGADHRRLFARLLQPIEETARLRMERDHAQRLAAVLEQLIELPVG